MQLLALLLLPAAALAATATTCPTVDKTPPPAHATCGKTGTVAHPALLRPPFVSSPSPELEGLTFCRDDCGADAGCKSFGFDLKNGECSLYGKTLAQMGYSAKGGKNNFLEDRSCFKVECPTS